MKKLNKQTLKAIAYAENAISFIFLNSDINDSINSIYIFGSAVRNELTKTSDIDLFIDCKNEKEIENIAKAALSRFYKSKDYEKWKLLNFTYPISIQVGNIKEWQLKISILSEGLLLYSKRLELEAAERKVLFVFQLPKDKKKYLHFIRRLYGRKEKGYREHGLIKEINGSKLSSNVIIIPKESQQKLVEILNKEKINHTMKEIFVF